MMHTGVVVRGMTTPEGAHPRAKYYMHTGYREGQGGVIYPSIGSLAAKELGAPDGTMPSYVAINSRSYGSGFLGPKHQPLLITAKSRCRGPARCIASSQFNNRVGLLEKMDIYPIRIRRTRSTITRRPTSAPPLQ